ADTDRGGEAGVLRREALAGREYLGTFGDIARDAADPLARLRRPLDRHAIAVDAGVLLHHDRILARRDRRAGEDARGGAGLERAPYAARHDALHDAQRFLRVGNTHRIAVHRTVVERRHVHGRTLRPRQHAAGRFEGRHLFDVGEGPGAG